MASIEPDLLAEVRAILRGHDEHGKLITRKDIAGRQPRVLAYLGMAVICAQPQQYLDVRPDGRYVKGGLAPTLEKILIIGVPHPTKVHPARIAAVCRRAGLYHKIQGKGGSKPMRLRACDKLTALAQLASEPGVAAFCREVDEADRMRQIPSPAIITGTGSVGQQVDQLIAWLNRLDPTVYSAFINKLREP